MRDPGTPGINEEFKWSVKEDVLKVQWLLLPPAPDYVLNLINCACKTGCKTKRCACKADGLKCMQLCQCSELCENGNSENDSEQSDGSESDFSESEDNDSENEIDDEN